MIFCHSTESFNHRALAFMMLIESKIHQHFREKALGLATERNSCLFVRGTVSWTLNDYTWKELPWSQRLRVRIPMSLVSRLSTFQRMMDQVRWIADKVAANYPGKLPHAYWNILAIQDAILQTAYREYGIKLCAKLRKYFDGYERQVDLVFWNQLQALEEAAYNGNISAKEYREAFTMRYIRLMEIAWNQLDPENSPYQNTGSNKS